LGEGDFTLAANPHLKAELLAQIRTATNISNVINPAEAKEATLATLGYDDEQEALEQDVVVVPLDCRVFPSPADSAGRHLGWHPVALEAMAAHANFAPWLQHALRHIHEACQQLTADPAQFKKARVYIVCFDNQGRHRSVRALQLASCFFLMAIVALIYFIALLTCPRSPVWLFWFLPCNLFGNLGSMCWNIGPDTIGPSTLAITVQTASSPCGTEARGCLDKWL
jgi:hypothetical protein